MAPVLIDHRGLVKIVSIAASTAVVIFFSGFFSGYQRAAVIYQPGSEIAPLALPEISGEPADIEPKLPQVIAAGESIDVDLPGVRDKIINDVYATDGNLNISKQESKSRSAIVSSTKQVFSSIDMNIDADTQSSTQKHSIGLQMEIDGVQRSAEAGKQDVASMINLDENNAIKVNRETSMPSIYSGSEELKKIKYSIQVGIYGKLLNAENMMSKLQAQQFDAYVSEYLNKKKEVLYHVRFGYFVDKASAVTALQEYKNKQKGDGYLVKFSPKSMAGISDSHTIEPSNNVKKSDNRSPSATLSSANTLNRISQLEISKTPNILTSSQTSIITN